MIVNKLLKRISDLEFEVEKLEKNEYYKYINGQAYFRQDYVLSREKEIERLKTELELYKDNQEHLNNLLEQKNNIINKATEYIENSMSGSMSINPEYEVVTMDKKEILTILKGSDKE